MSLLIDQAVEPDGYSATPQTSGTLAASTVYYYRVAAVTDRGETCACDAFSGTTTDVNKTLALAWNAVCWSEGHWRYKIYRNTSDSWDSGNLLLQLWTRTATPMTENPAPGTGVQ